MAYGPITLFAAAKTAEECGGGKLLGIIPRWYEHLPFDESCNIAIDFKANPESLWIIGFNIIDILLRIGGIIAFLFIIYGGFLLITSQGEPEGLNKAKSTIMNALIGVVISILASSIVIYIAGKF